MRNSEKWGKQEGSVLRRKIGAPVPRSALNGRHRSLREWKVDRALRRSMLTKSALLACANLTIARGAHDPPIYEASVARILAIS